MNKTSFVPIRAVTINPYPDQGNPGLHVTCDREGKIGIEIKEKDAARFIISAAAAIQLADFIRHVQDFNLDSEFSLAS